MFKFSEYLTEAAGKALQSNVSNIKTKGHIKRYIFPLLSAEQKKQSLYDLGKFFSDKDVAESDQHNHGTLHNPKAEFTHELASNHGENKKGTGVRVTGVYNNNGTITARTANHGDMPISKLGTPSELAAAPKTSEGFELEHVLQKNVDPRFKPAGSTGDSWDFVAGDPNEENSIKGKAVKKDESKPIFRGESKASKKGTVAMGTATIKYNKDAKKWEYSQGKSKMQPKFEEAVHQTSGLSILDHLNKYHKNGKFDKRFSTPATPGTTQHYLNGIGANALHLHRYAKNSRGEYTMNHGTSYTIGDDNLFKNKLGIAHLDNEGVNRLDGSLNVDPAGEGVVQIKHRPKPAVFKELADKSREDPENHMDLSKEEHGNLFRDRYNKHLSFLQSAQSTKPTPMQVATQRIAAKKVTPAPVAKLQTRQVSPDESRWADDGGPSNEMFGKKFHADHERM